MSDGIVISTDITTSSVDSSKWRDMNFNELLNQKTVMLDRYDYLFQLGSTNAANHILNGINLIDSLIAQKTLK